jgi:hypothetical protein
MENKQKELIEKIKYQTEELWNTIEEAKKYNLRVKVGFEDYLIRAELEIVKVLY